MWESKSISNYMSIVSLNTSKKQAHILNVFGILIFKTNIVIVCTRRSCNLFSHKTIHLSFGTGIAFG